MIGTGLKKFAQKRGLTSGNGFIYGKLCGQHISMDEGGGWKALYIYLHSPADNSVENAELSARALHILTDCNLKDYRLHRDGAVSTQNGFARLVFFDNPGTMKCIERYVDEVLPRLAEAGIGCSRCAWCGEEMDGDTAYALLNGSILPVHASCLPQLSDHVDELETTSRSGSVLLGAIGALLGAVLGAVVWALVYSLGYIAGIVGFVIGFLANFFYGKFGGKRSGLRIVIVVLALVVGSVLGQTAGVMVDFMSVYDEMDLDEEEITPMDWLRINMEQFLLYDQEKALGMRYDREVQRLPEAERADVISREEYIEACYDPAVEDARDEIRAAYLKDLGIGLIFGIWGCSGLFRKVHRENKRRKVKQLG